MDDICFAALSSGSRGNCIMIWDSEDTIIIDMGISNRRFMSLSSQFISDHGSISLLVTHEHSDHCSGVSTFISKRMGDVYATPGTLEAMGLPGYSIGSSMIIGNFVIERIDISHDAAEPAAFVIRNSGIKITVASDMGKVPERLITAGKDSDLIALEANHDVQMLKNGNYPEPLKRRILGEHGHLSNDQSAGALSRMVSKKSKIVLTHLSQENNLEDLAVGSVKSYLENRGVEYSSIECASQWQPRAYHSWSQH
ncbi:MAG: MBL fold metallo-hydrolase [Candidatus Thermoplasmatota archaeon]|nr:MBL fold metallo-hydrolase [Candidatus Thermoplasmatota archaeon]